MALSSLFKRKNSGDADGGAAASSAPVDGVQKVRTRTRRRLIGAVVLVTVGVIGFPLLFESQPRPIPVDIPIEIPSQDTAPALVLPAARREAPVVRSVQPASSAEVASAATAALRDAAPASAPAPNTPASVPAVVANARPVVKASAVAAPVSAERVPVPIAKPVPVNAPAVDLRAASTPARPGSEPASGAAAAPRFVVQVGAFADPASAREVRAKLEKLGLKTYAQTAETKDGKRIRVRLGPFPNRIEADKAAGRARDAGVTSVVLTI